MSESVEMDETLDDIEEDARNVIHNLLPAKSRKRYESRYDQFLSWKRQKKIQVTSESVLLVYFEGLSHTYKSSTLWATYSMLKSQINLNENIDIKNYPKLTQLLKRKSEGYRPKKSQIFSSADLQNFLNDAPDECYLATKIVTIFGVAGACRTDEILNVKVQHVATQGNILLVTIPDTKTKIQRKFTIDGPFCDIVKNYMSLRPENCSHDRFFINFQKNACTRQPIGKNKLAKIPCEIAKFLKLPDPETYTGHSFRRSSATLLADAGADLVTIKQHGGWKSSTVAEGYIENSTTRKRKVGNLITSDIKLNSPSSSKIETPFHPPLKTRNRPATVNVLATSTITAPIELPPIVPTSDSCTNLSTRPIDTFNSDICRVPQIPQDNFENISIENNAVSFENRLVNLDAKQYPVLNIQNCTNVNIYYK